MSLYKTYLSDDCRFLSLNGSTYKFTSNNITKLQNVKLGSGNYSSAEVNGSIIYTVREGNLEKYNTDTDVLLASYPLPNVGDAEFNSSLEDGTINYNITVYSNRIMIAIGNFFNRSSNEGGIKYSIYILVDTSSGIKLIEKF